MRKILTLIAMMALAGCGGGGGSSTAPNPNPQPVPTTAPQGNLVTPTFTIIIPPTSTSGKVRKPNFVSPGVHSVVDHADDRRRQRRDGGHHQAEPGRDRPQPPGLHRRLHRQRPAVAARPRRRLQHRHV